MTHAPLSLNLVTLDEMRSILMNNSSYDEFRERMNIAHHVPSYNERDVPYVLTWHVQPLLYRHIIAEQLFRNDREKVNWKDLTNYEPIFYITLAHLLMSPLVWMDCVPILPDMVVEGRVAKEQYMEDRYGDVQDLIQFIVEQGILDCVDDPFIWDEDEPGEGIIKGMHHWLPLTQDYELLMQNAMNGAHVTVDDLRAAKTYDAVCLRSRLGFIAEKRGGKRAAEVLRLLQKEWKSIKIWKTELQNMSEDDINVFEYNLFNGFDDLLDEWETKIPSAIDHSLKPAAPFTPDFITFTKLRTNDYNIVALYQELLRLKWIADGNPDNFTVLFSGKFSEQTVTWTGRVGKDNLYALFKMMADHSFIKVPDGHSLQRIVESHFVNQQGENITGIDSGKPSQKSLTTIDQLRQILAARQTFDE